MRNLFINYKNMKRRGRKRSTPDNKQTTGLKAAIPVRGVTDCSFLAHVGEKNIILGELGFE
jgi:hypothetical protein